jgi:uncharacterized protein YciI
MPYMIETTDKPGHQDLRQQVRADHLRFLEAKKHLLLAAGARLADEGGDALGGLYILDVDDRASAERFIAEDPFTRAGLFDSVVVTRWRKAFFNFENCLS